MTPPLVVIAKPKTGAVVERKSTVTITVTAGDDLGVIAELVVFVNGVSICRRHAPPFWCEWNVPAKPNQAYTLQASARDLAGHTALSPLERIRSSSAGPADMSVAPQKITETPPSGQRTPWGTPEW